MATLTVGSTGGFQTIASAVAASHDGDVLQVQAGQYTNDFSTINTAITIEGIGGMVDLVATEPPPDKKGIFTVNNDLTIDNLSFSGAAISPNDGNNGAGIRYQAGNLTVENSDFHNNQDGILATPNIADTGTITIENSKFANNGAGDGFSHNLYVTDVAQLDINDSYFTAANVGHEIKSRAEQTTITNSRIQDGPTGTASYDIDLPNGGNALIQGNTIEKGPNAENPAMISYGEEGGIYAQSSLTVSGNTLLNDLGPNAVGIVNRSGVTADVTGNAVYGLTYPGNLTIGPANVSGTTILSSEPALNTSDPYAPASSGGSGGGTTGSSGTSNDTIVLNLSEDAYMGDAQFVASVDGHQLGPAQSVTALHSQGATEAFTFQDALAAGTHDLSVTFLNDAYGGSPSLDRNLYVDSVDVNGVAVPGASGTLDRNGSIDLPFTTGQSPTPPP
jgi:hypothetical protein